jgi:hypothetical protein
MHITVKLATSTDENLHAHHDEAWSCWHQAMPGCQMKVSGISMNYSSLFQPRKNMGSNGPVS